MTSKRTPIADWALALRRIPRLDKDSWEALDPLARWLIATRAAVLILTFTSSAIAGILAWRDGLFRWDLWLATTIGLLLAHATNNLLNDWTDHIKGVDRDNYFRSQYGPQPLEHGLLTVGQIWRYIFVTGLPALAIGLALIYLRGSGVAWLLAAGVFFVLFYTWPLKYIGLGDLAVLAVWGPLMVAGGYYVVTGLTSEVAVVASLPWAIATTVVIFGKHIDKLPEDKAKGIRTLPVLLGHRIARWAALLLVAVQYGCVLWLILQYNFGWAMLLVLLAAKPLWYLLRVFANPRPESPPAEFPDAVWPLWYVAFAFHHSRWFAGGYLGGLLLDTLLLRIT